MNDLYLIRMDKPDFDGTVLYWNYSKGAVVLTDASIYTEGDVKMLALPYDSQWVHYTHVPF